MSDWLLCFSMSEQWSLICFSPTVGGAARNLESYDHHVTNSADIIVSQSALLEINLKTS